MTDEDETKAKERVVLREGGVSGGKDGCEHVSFSRCCGSQWIGV